MRFWREILILILLILSIWFYVSNKRNKVEAKRWEGNYIASTDTSKANIIAKELTIKELMRDRSALIENAKKQGIKSKQIQYIHTVKFRDTGSTQFRVDTSYIESKNTPVLYGRIDIPCFKADVWLMGGDTIADMKYTRTYDFTSTGFWKREKEFKLFGFKLWDYGTKQNYISVKDNCADAMVVENEMITIKKK